MKIIKNKIFQWAKYLCCFLFFPKKFMHIADDLEHKRTIRLRKAIGRSFIIVVCCFIISLILALMISVPTQVVFWLGIIGTGIILWATLGYLGWKIQSWKGETLPEQINRMWFMVLYIVGTLLLFISILFNIIR